MTQATQKIWFITGISSGLGKALTEAVLQHGDFVIGTFRKPEQVDEFNRTYPDKGYAMLLDVTQRSQIDAAAEQVTSQFGRVDVLVNNAGYGFAGAIEEASEAEIRAVFEANFFGAVAVTQAFLPLMRQQRSGHIIQMSSHGGMKAFAGFGVYNASKFALEGISEAVAAEVAPLGIRVTMVEPGPFRTEFAAAAFTQAHQQLDDYNATAGVFRSRMQAVNGQQEGDPVKAAEAIYHITTIDNPPLRLPLGKIALNTLAAKLASVQQDINAWRSVAEGATF